MRTSTVKRTSRSWVYRSGIHYTVYDQWSECIVLMTTSKTVADYWADRVNRCEHPIHYDSTDHDQRVEQWQQTQQSH